MNEVDIEKVDWSKGNGLLPAIVQNGDTGAVLMLGYVNEEALQKSIESGMVHFWSRSKNRLWKKGESSGNVLELNSIELDCDQDAFLLKVTPKGPTCHTGTPSCFTEKNESWDRFLWLEQLIDQKSGSDPEQSYTAKLLTDPVDRVAKKVGEEAVELALAGVLNSKEDFLDEASDLVFHFLVLLKRKNVSLDQVVSRLKSRRR